jgi:TonB-linked SusC/RagA family outer membrane protein
MRRFLTLFTMLMLCGALAFAQNRVVSGRVADENGNPVPFASVKVKGSKSGVSADANGQYTIRVKDGDILEITSSGFKSREVNVGTQTVINTAMEKGSANTLQEVVVTGAFNVKRTARSTSSNVQNVSGEQLNTIRQPNINNALAGKVAGAQVRSQSAANLGRETQVRLRGENGILAGPGALYVVDGTIMPSGNDINTDDVEDISVLQGPAAAALFGPDGANGAVVITTKKAKRGQKGLGIEINSGIQFDKVYILPNYQNAYAGGNGLFNGASGIGNLKQFVFDPAKHPAEWAALNGKYYPDYEDDESWGPRMVGQEYIPWYAWYPGTQYSYKTAKLTPQPNNARDFFNTGVNRLNNISFAKAGDNYSFRASYTNQDQKGIIPESWLRRNTFNINGTFDLSNRFTVGANINYLNQQSNSENDDGYSNNTTGSFNNWFHRDLDMKIIKEFADYKTPEGYLATWNHRNPDAFTFANPAGFYGAYYWFSPYAWQKNVLNFNQRDRLFGDVSLTYKPNSDLRLKFTYRKNQLNTSSDTRQYSALQISQATSNLSGYNYWENLAGRSAPWGGYAIGTGQSNRQNFEFLASYTKKIRDFNITVNAGMDILKVRQTVFNANTLGGLIIPDLFLLSNSKNNIAQTNTITNSGRRSLFASANIGFRNYLFLDGTYRRDYSSTEAPGYAIDTKSFGASFVFSDLIKDKVPFLSFGKIRASTGQLLNTLGPYQNSVLYAVNPQQWNGNLLQTEPNTLVSPNLSGTANTENEIGVELRFLKNRLGISATYWDRTNIDFPFNATIYGGSGYNTFATNAGKVTKKGIDLQLLLVPFKSRNFEWNLTATWGRLLDNKIVDIYTNPVTGESIDRIALANTGLAQSGTSAYIVSEKGQQWGQIRGIGYKRINGLPVLDADGFFVDEPEVNFGSALPDFTGGVQNTFNIYKNFTVNVNIDYSFGGKFFSVSEWYGHGTGLFEATAVLNDKGNSIRDNVADGGGVHVFGVDNTGKPVDYYVPARDYFQQFSYGAGIAEPYIRDMTFVKLRELSIGYNLPVNKLGLGKVIRSANLSLVARNAWLIYRKAKSFDPSEISSIAGEEAQLPGTRAFGVNLKVGF